jgi:hypothetical protein
MSVGTLNRRPGLVTILLGLIKSSWIRAFPFVWIDEWNTVLSANIVEDRLCIVRSIHE